MRAPRLGLALEYLAVKDDRLALDSACFLAALLSFVAASWRLWKVIREPSVPPPSSAKWNEVQARLSELDQLATALAEAYPTLSNRQ